MKWDVFTSNRMEQFSDVIRFSIVTGFPHWLRMGGNNLI